jgi:hypothetical protein
MLAMQAWKVSRVSHVPTPSPTARELSRVCTAEREASRHCLAWALEWKSELRHIQPGKQSQNGRLREEECLRVSWFTNLYDACRNRI